MGWFFDKLCSREKTLHSWIAGRRDQGKLAVRWRLHVRLSRLESLEDRRLLAVGPWEEFATLTSRLQPAAFAGADIVVVAGEFVSFDGQGASPDAEIVQYLWDFESDGVSDFSSPETGSTTHLFRDPGDYRCLLTVKDAGGRVAQDTRHITVIVEEVDAPSAESRPPSAERAATNPPDGVTHRYAVMINGGSESRFWIDVQLAYDMLTDGYGFPASDIYLLNHNGTDPEGGNPGGMIDYSATYANLQTVFSELAAGADADDEVFLWITDHGQGYSGPQDQGGQYLGYCTGRISVDPGDEPDFLESDFPLRSLYIGGDYWCNHGLDVWKVRRKYSNPTNFYRNMYVSSLDNVYIEEAGTTVSDGDVFIERLVDFALGDTNRDGYIDTTSGEVFDFDGDGNQPYDPSTGQFDEDDWGTIDEWTDDYNDTNGWVPVDGSPYRLFDEGFQGKLCIDLGYAGGALEVDGRDEDNAGLFDWMDVNGDGDTLDVVSVDEVVCLYSGDLYDDDLAELVDQLSVARITVVAEPCFSGGLVEDLTAPDRVICTATIEEAVSWGNTFIRYFVAALHKKDQYNNSVDADANGNGYISMLEAFNYAADRDPLDEIPQYDDNGDGVSQPYPVPAGGDGSLGADTYLTDPLDFGDAPAPYPTLLADDGARHDATRPTLGANRDTEADGQPTANADGDDTTGTPDDEDGVTVPVLSASTFSTTAASLTVDLQNADAASNRLDAWIDFNQDGDWLDTGEQVLTNYDLGTTNGAQTVSITVPQNTGANIVYGTSYARPVPPQHRGQPLAHRCGERWRGGRLPSEHNVVWTARGVEHERGNGFQKRPLAPSNNRWGGQLGRRVGVS